jgi:hypothetical protein
MKTLENIYKEQNLLERSKNRNGFDYRDEYERAKDAMYEYVPLYFKNKNIDRFEILMDSLKELRYMNLSSYEVTHACNCLEKIFYTNK